MSLLSRLGALALPLLLLLSAGCAAKGDVHVSVHATNHAMEGATLLLKAWDHEGVLVFNATQELAPGGTAPTVGSIQGPVPTYGSQYSWFAQAGDRSQQVKHDPVGLVNWSVHVHDDRIEFVFGTA